jgi:PAS domain-containing protein
LDQFLPTKEAGHEQPTVGLVDRSIRRVQRDCAYIVTVARDITERKGAEEARLKHAAIVESSEDGIISKDLEAVITSWNGGAERIFGYAKAGFLSRSETTKLR